MQTGPRHICWASVEGTVRLGRAEPRPDTPRVLLPLGDTSQTSSPQAWRSLASRLQTVAGCSLFQPLLSAVGSTPPFCNSCSSCSLK